MPANEFKMLKTKRRDIPVARFSVAV